MVESFEGTDLENVCLTVRGEFQFSDHPGADSDVPEEFVGHEGFLIYQNHSISKA